MLIARYINREIGLLLASLTGILLSIFLSNQFVKYFNAVALGKLALLNLLRLIALEIPQLLSLLLPLALFLSILLTYSRLYSEQEMLILFSAGISRLKSFYYILPITLMIFFIVAILNIWILPQILQYKDQLLSQTGLSVTLQTLIPGRFQGSTDGKTVIYVEDTSLNHTSLKKIFVAQKQDNRNSWSIVAAGKGYLKNILQEPYVILSNGYRYIKDPDNQKIEIWHFREYGMHLKNPVIDILKTENALPIEVLWQHKTGNYMRQVAELQWRFAIPLSVILLALFAVPLSQVKPRQGRYGNLLPGILVYIIYENMLFVTRHWIAQDRLDPWIGMWSVHIGLVICTLFLYKKNNAIS